MTAIALTGGLGSGKSFVMSCFAKLGCHTLSVDSISKYVTRRYPNVKHNISKLLLSSDNPAEFLEEYALDSPANLKSIQLITQTYIVKLRKRLMEAVKHSSKGILIVEIPLLAELYNKAEIRQTYDFVITTYCTRENQKIRALQRPGMNPKKFDNITSLQTFDDNRRLISDFIIDTNVTHQNTENQVIELYNKLLMP